MADYWVLDGHETRKVDTVLEWAQRFEKTSRHVGLTETRLHRISTVFLGLDHSWGIGPPLLFETMVFDLHGESGAESDIDGSCDRYSTWDEAEAGHAAIVRRVEKLEAASDSLVADLSATTGK
jgi:hypothetical protein